jgi:murein DD-endopeptidase MepM/ murein hydrolase activator NlpD
MAVALGWQGHVDSNLSFSAFFDRDHTLVARFMPQFPNAFEGPLIAENGSGLFVIGQGDWHQDGEGNKLLLAVGATRRNYPAPLRAGRWYHLALRVVVGADAMTLEPFLNGRSLGAPVAVRRDDPGLPRGTVRFGKRTTGGTLNGHNGQYFGLLDEVAIFSAALPPARIAALASSTSPLTGDEPDLLTGFSFDGRRVQPRMARSISLHGVAQLVGTSANWDSTADAPLLPLPTQNAVMSLPFKKGEEWRVVNDIETPAAHHAGYASFCWDFVLADEPGGNGGTYPQGTGGAPLFATATGRISGIEESNPAGTSKPNIVSLEQAPGEHAGYLHIQQQSVVPGLGDRIVSGARIALAGSTGMIDPDANHLHFAVSDQLDGTPGFVTIPTTFSSYDVKAADGEWHRVSRGMPRAGEIVRVPPLDQTGGAGVQAG